MPGFSYDERSKKAVPVKGTAFIKNMEFLTFALNNDCCKLQIDVDLVDKAQKLQ
jgi:hypothetical protein